jgi:hypothetical protein
VAELRPIEDLARAATQLSSPLAGYSCGPVGFFDASHLDYKADARGILWLWEMPRRDATYVIGNDPTVGKTGWNLQSATTDDRKIDNAAIEVLRVGKLKALKEKGLDGKEVIRYVREPDIQVAEYAAPVDPITCASVINAIGKLFRGDSEEDGCLVNLEVGPGPGVAVFPELYSRFGYTNIFQQPYLDSPRPKRTIDYGFWATQQSKQLLWTKGVRHIWLDGLQVHSPWLLEEMVDATAEKFAQPKRGLIAGPTHDDRFTATLLAVWAAHAWSMDQADAEETALRPIESPGAVEHQCSLISSAAAKAKDEERWERMLEGF